MAKIDLTAVVFVLSYLLYQIGAPPHQTSEICHNYPYQVDSIFWLPKTSILSSIVLLCREVSLDTTQPLYAIVTTHPISATVDVTIRPFINGLNHSVSCTRGMTFADQNLATVLLTR